ncbi:uncharacterized protein LOC122280526 [Carya illinoinensis]|uniref:uncharacterized protein LOC122280526 n=1 Tax=Carya illinoinensis TaxID=32201 RepID=UPI001C729323|nr:uncharacterized protein LOC122280526 [Carya illinoinensis]
MSYYNTLWLEEVPRGHYPSNGSKSPIVHARAGHHQQPDFTGHHDIRGSLTRLTKSLSTQEKGKFPAQPQPNPQGQVRQVSEAVETSNIKLVKVVTTLRSGRILVSPATPDPTIIGKNSNPMHVETEVKNWQAPAPFPTRLTLVHKDKNHVEIFEIFKQVGINIPLLDAIQKIPTYEKFLKDLCTIKRKLNVKKKAFLTVQVSAIIQSNTPPKYKDPGSPTIACMIRNSKIGHALLDFRSSVNLLPYCVYQKLGLGELKSTSITLQLADRSIKIPRGVVDDVLV